MWCGEYKTTPTNSNKTEILMFKIVQEESTLEHLSSLFHISFGFISTRCFLFIYIYNITIYF